MKDLVREPPPTSRQRVRRVSISRFVGAFAVYASLDPTQPILPRFTRAPSITPAAASLTISVSTLALALVSVTLPSRPTPSRATVAAR